MDPLTVMLVLTVAFKVGTEIFKARAQEKQLEVQKEEARLQATQHDLRRQNELRKVLAEREVVAGAQGFSEGSFAAINMDDFANYAEDQRTAELNLMMNELNISQTEKGIRQKALIGSMADIFTAGAQMFGAPSGTMAPVREAKPEFVAANVVGEL
jgi:hypothetical protein